MQSFIGGKLSSTEALNTFNAQFLNSCRDKSISRRIINNPQFFGELLRLFDKGASFNVSHWLMEEIINAFKL